jgi:hypothetical protein
MCIGVYDIVWMGWIHPLSPRRTLWTSCVHLYGFMSYRRLSPQFQFSLSAAAVSLVYLSLWIRLKGLRSLVYKKDLLSIRIMLFSAVIPPMSLHDISCKFEIGARYFLKFGIFVLREKLPNLQNIEFKLNSQATIFLYSYWTNLFRANSSWSPTPPIHNTCYLRFNDENNPACEKSM